MPSDTTLHASAELGKALAELTMLQHKRTSATSARERFESTARRKQQAHRSANQQTIANLRKRMEVNLKAQVTSAERNSKLMADIAELARVAGDTSLSSSAAAAELRAEQRHYLQAATEMQRREGQAASSRLSGGILDLPGVLSSSGRGASVSGLAVEGGGLDDARSPDTSHILDSSLLQASHLASSAGGARSLSRQPDPAVALAREKEAVRRQMMVEMGKAEEEAASASSQSGSQSSPSKSIPKASSPARGGVASPAAAAHEASKVANRGETISSAAAAQAPAKGVASEDAAAVAKQKAHPEETGASSGAGSDKAGTLGETATSVASVLSEDELAEAQIAEVLNTPKMWYKTIRHLAKQLEEGVSQGDGSETMYNLSTNPCSAPDLAQVVSTVTTNDNAVKELGLSPCASAFSELLKRYPGALAPKQFISGYLWEADPSTYKDKELVAFLTDETAELWKAVKRHVSHMRSIVPLGCFAEALSLVLLGSTKPTAATRAKIKAFMEAVCATSTSAAPASSSTAPQIVPIKALSKLQEDSEEEEDVDMGAAPAGKAGSGGGGAAKLSAGGGSKPPIVMGAGKAKSTVSNASSGGGSSYKMSMAAMMKNQNLARDLDDSETESEPSTPGKRGARPGTAPTGGVGTGGLNALLKGKQWATATPVDDGDDDEFDIL